MATEENISVKMEVTTENESPLETDIVASSENQEKDESHKQETNTEESVKQENTTDESKTPQEKVQTVTGAVAASNPHYRVKISGLPRFYTPTDPLLVDFKRLLANLGLNFKYIRSPKKGNSWLYITFYNQTNQEKALKLLKNYKWKGRTLICTLVVADVLKRKQEDSGQEASKKPRLDIPIEEQMLMSTIPYHSISYEEQLSKKNEEAQCLFKWLSVCMEKKTPELIGYIDKQIAKFKKTQLPFKLDMVRASPVIDGYRNKCEFRIGLEPTSKKVIVGYRVDNQEGDNIAVAPPDTLRHLPKEMLEVVKTFEQFVQESPHPPQITNHDPGVWRLLHVRINKAKQLMVVVMINPTVLETEVIDTLKKQLVDFFTTGPASGKNVVSLYFHTDNDVKTLGGGDKMKRPQGQLELLWGESHIEEQLLDLQLEIDPNFYFQNNTWGAEELYKAVKELAGVDDETTVLDLCCGSGGMGMMFAKDCKEVIGVEVMDVNVDDAKRLAAKNGLTNCEFLQGSVDDLFPELEEKLKGKKVVPILDPPRAGISKQFIAKIRKSTEVNRLVYVCTSQFPPTQNLLDLSSKNEKLGFQELDPFVVKRVIPIDLHPHMLRVELVILCERLTPDEIPKPKRPPKTKKNAKKGNVQVKRWFSEGYNWNGRSTMFPTEEMVRMYSGGVRKIQQEVDYQKRDSLYPPPLRGALYQGFEEEYFNNNFYVKNENSYFYYDRAGPKYSVPQYRERSYPQNLARFSNFQRDLGKALDSYYPPQPLTSSKLAYANALLEEGMRIASQVLDNGHPRMPSSGGYYDRRPKNSTKGSKYYSNKYRY